MEKKKSSKGKNRYSSDWEKRLAIQKKRRQRMRKVFIGVLVAAVLAVAYLGIMIALDDKTPETADSADGGRQGDENGGTATSPERDPGSPPVAGPDKPSVGDPGVTDPPEAVDPATTPPAPNSPYFGDTLLKKNLQLVDLGNERNFGLLLGAYAAELEEEEDREFLAQIHKMVLEKEFEEAIRSVDEKEFPVHIKEAVRAVILTRGHSKEQAGAAFSTANRAANRQPGEFYFEWGIYYLGSGDLQQSYNQFVVAIRKNSRAPHFHFAAAGAAFDLRKWKNVVEHVDSGAKRMKNLPPRLGMLAAFAEVRLGKHEEAVARSRKLLEADPEAHQVRLFLARVLGAAGELKESLEVYTELQEADADLPTIRVEMVRAYLANEDTENAVRLAAEVAGEKEDNTRIQAWYADVLAAAGKTEEAGRILEGIADDLRPNELAVLKSIVAVREKDYAGAARALEPFHTQDPNLAMRWAAFKLEGDEAGIDVQEVLREHHLNAIQWRALANLAVTKQIWGMAAFAYDRAMAAGDDSTGTLNNWAWTAMQNPSGFNVQKVVRACEEALEKAPDNPNVIHTLGQAFLKSDQIGRCTELLVKYQAVTENSAELSLLQGQAYLALRAGPSALEALERCLAIMVDAPSWNLELTREEVEKMIADLKG